MGMCDSIEEGGTSQPGFVQAVGDFIQELEVGEGTENEDEEEGGGLFDDFFEDYDNEEENAVNRLEVFLAKVNTTKDYKYDRKELTKLVDESWHEERKDHKNLSPYKPEGKIKIDKLKFQARSSEGIPSQIEFLLLLSELIIEKKQLQSVLPKEFFQIMTENYFLEYWSTDSREMLIKLLLNYINFSLSLISKNYKNESSYTLENFSDKFGSELGKLMNEVKMKNAWTEKNLTFAKVFQKKKFILQNEAEMEELSSEVRTLVANSSTSLAYLSSYLTNCCRYLESKGKSTTEINQILKEKVAKVKDFFSPKAKLDEEMTYLKRSFEEDELNVFKTEAFPYQVKTLQFQEGSKEDQLTNFIMEMVAAAKKHYSVFTELTSHCCLENEGFAYKSNLKLKEKSQEMPLLRVKEKLLKDKVGEYYKDKKYDSKNIEELRKAEVEYLKNVLNQVYEKMDKVEFTVSDMLRGKCMFNKISHINKALSAIKKEVEERSKSGEDIQIVEIDNRLKKITTDLVLKIRMESLVCEFQLALKFNQAENEIHHKMYEVERSKVYTPITMLFSWNDSTVGEFFSSIESLINERANKDKKGMIEIMNQLKKSMYYTSSGKVKSIPFANKQDFSDFEKIKKDINSLKVQSQIEKTALLRAGKCEKEMKAYDNAIKALGAFYNENSENTEVLLVLGDVLRNNSKFQKSLDYYNEFLTKYEEDNTKFDNVSVQHAYSEKAECLWELGKDEESFQILEPLYQFQVDNFGEDSKYTAKTQSDIGHILYKMGKYKEAIEIFEKSIALFEKVNEKQDLDYIEAFNRMSMAYLSMGQFSKSLEYLNRSLSLVENVTGKESIETADVIMKFGVVYQNMNKLKEAENYYLKYGEMAEKIVTKDSQKYAGFLFALSSLKTVSEKYSEAEELLKECEILILTISDCFSGDYTDICNQFGFLFVTTGKFQEALEEFERALEISNENSGGNNTKLLTVRGNIAYTYHQMGNTEEAMKLYGEILQECIQIYGEESSEIGIHCNNIMTVCIETERYEEALNILNEAVVMYEKLKIENDNNLILIHLNGAELHGKLGNEEEAMKYYKKVLRHYEVTTGINSSGYADILYRMGCSLKVYFNKASEGKKEMKKALDIFKKLDHPRVSEIETEYKNT